MIDRRLARSRRARRELAALSDRAPNVDEDELAGARLADGWRIDDYRQLLAREPAGDAAARGAFAIARRALRDYELADPAMVRALYDPSAALDGRDMLLQVRFGPLRFLVGCRVGAVVDDVRTIDGRRARAWGWSYTTLDGHFERGRMDFAVLKWLDEGVVELRLHVVSRDADAVNPLVRLGLALFGRREQVRFARRCCERMAAIVERDLRAGRSALGEQAGAAQQAS